MSTIKQEIERLFMDVMKADAIGPFDPTTLADVLFVELEREWHNMPHFTKIAIIGVGTELKRHFAKGVAADIQAAQVVASMRGQSQ